MNGLTLFFLISFLFSFNIFSNPPAQPTLPEVLSMSMVYVRNHPDYWKIDGYRHIGGRDRRVAVKVVARGYDNGEVAVYTDSQCQNKVGSTPARENKVYLSDYHKVADMYFASHFIKVDLDAPGKYTFYSQVRLNDGSYSPCSKSKAIYTLSSGSATVFQSKPAPPSDVTIVSSPKHGSPIVRVHGANGNWVNLYGDSECMVPICNREYEARAGGRAVDIQVNDLPLGSYTIYANTSRNKQWSDCSTAYATYQVSTPKPPITVGLRLASPNEASSTVKTPTIEVTGVYVDDVVRLFSDDQCTQQIGSGTSESGRIRIAIQKLELGDHRFYANITRDGATSACSTNYVDYAVTRPSAPSGLRLARPNRTFSTKSRPPVVVSGVLAADVVKLFSDDRCTREVDSGTAQGESIRFSTKTLSPGNYRFYARLTRGGEDSLCSTAFVDYEVLAPVDDSMLVPIPAYDSAKFHAGANGFGNRNGPVEWWISPDGTFWVTRDWSQIEQKVLAKIVELEKKGEDTSAAEKELASIQRKINDQYKFETSLMIAGKFGDEVSRKLLDQEYNVFMAQLGRSSFRGTITITTTTAIVEAVEDRYGVRLNNVRDNVIRPPTGLKLIRPDQASSRLARPTLEVTGALPRGVTKIFLDDQCAKEVGNIIVRQEDVAYIMNLPRKLFKQEGIRLAISEKLRPGNYRLYVNTTRDNLGLVVFDGICGLRGFGTSRRLHVDTDALLQRGNIL